jgi:DNA-binding transcriptional ArsR family regulator
MDKKLIAGRLQEINEGLVSQSGGLVEAHFRKSKRSGAAARLCNVLRGQDVIDNYEMLAAAGGELGISADTLDRALSELEEIGYVTLHKSGGDIRKVEERIPLLADSYELIGQKWLDSKPSDIERATIEILDDLLVASQRERDIKKKYNLDTNDFAIVADVGTAGSFYKTYTSPVDGSTISLSPLYHDENPEVLLKLFDRFPDFDVSKILRSIREYQGKPIDTIRDPILIEAIRTGCIPTPSVDSSGGKKHFAFTPVKGVGQLEKSLLEKARAIVACVRYGQHYAGITRIKYPLLILESLKTNKRLGAHSEILKQYALLHKLGVGRITRNRLFRDRYNFDLIDIPENLRALDLAIQYLAIKEVTKTDLKIDEARQLLLPGFYGSPTKTRMSLRNVKTTKMSEQSINQLNHLIIGGSSGF